LFFFFFLVQEMLPSMTRQETPVYLNVYDLQEGINDRTHWAGVGAYHSGVEVLGEEWSFGHTPEDRSGVFSISPRSAEGCKFRQAILMGTTTAPHREIRAVLDRLTEKFWGPTYHIVARNCNHFSDEFCRELLGVPVPRWVNRLAFLGSLVQCILPEDLGGAAPPAAISDAEQSVPLVRAFDGPGQMLSAPAGGGGANSGGSLNASGDIRERLARATEARLAAEASGDGAST
jgi:hypothetical protein